jgi:nucleoside-diphosphate-sugar epimerase
MGAFCDEANWHMRNVSIIGYGPVGRDTAALLVKRGDALRIVQRSKPPALPDGCTFLSADSTDREATIQACAGVDTVVCCLGFPYDSTLWKRVWPVAMANILEGCAASGARLVFCDNLYMYGPQTKPLTEDMPLTTYGRKPAIRAEITRMWLAAHQAGRVRTVAVRAPDFYGPGVPTSVLGAFGVARLLNGQPALMPYPIDQPHDYNYVPDFARALVSLVDAPDDAYGQAWHVPSAQPTRTLRDILTIAAGLIGVAPRITVLPQFLAPVIGLFAKEVGEIVEMRFQWDRPYIVDASKFAARFWSDPTPLEDGLRETIAYYRRRTPPLSSRA